MYQGMPVESGSCSSLMFADILISLSRRNWTGGVEVSIVSDNINAQKIIYFTKGEITFSSSSQVEDRLGEILYRKNLIPLDKIVRSSLRSKNADKIKFGQALMKNNSVSAANLWSALKVQLVETLKTIFYFDEIRFKIDPEARAANHVSFLESSEEIIAFASINGEIYKKLSKILDQNIHFEVNEDRFAELDDNSYIYNITSNIKELEGARDYVSRSHVPPAYAKAELLEALQRGLVSMDRPWPTHSVQGLSSFPELTTLLEDYSGLVQSSFPVFKQKAIEFPVDAMNQLMVESNLFGMGWLTLDSAGQLSEFSHYCIATALQLEPGMKDFFQKRILSLYHFLGQVIRDQLPEQVNKQFRVA